MMVGFTSDTIGTIFHQLTVTKSCRTIRQNHRLSSDSAIVFHLGPTKAEKVPQRLMLFTTFSECIFHHYLFSFHDPVVSSGRTRPSFSQRFSSMLGDFYFCLCLGVSKAFANYYNRSSSANNSFPVQPSR